jgi:hypothetical protein
MLNSNFVFIGTAIASVGSIAYLIEVLRGRARPNRVSFFLWSINPLIVYFAQTSQGVCWQSSLLALSQGIFPFLILISSFVNKKSEWKITKRDLLLGLLSVFGLILWYLTKVGNIAILFSILADGLAALPTIFKSYEDPDSEVAWPWILTSVGVVFTVLTFTKITFENSGFIIYVFFANLIIYSLIQFRIGEKLKPKNHA